MRILFIGDVVGTPGVNVVRRAVPLLRAAENLDLVIANAENASGGSGLYPNTYKQLRKAGVDAVTLGDHIYKKTDVVGVLQKDEPVCKPANFPADAPGRDHVLCAARDGTPVGVVSVLGRTFMRPVDCPFRAADRVLKHLDGKARVVVVDVHAEATADKYLMVHHLKGRVSAVLGTHTHVPTADEQIFPGGTAFVCDVGMTGPYGGILGRRADRVLSAALSFVPTPFDVATEDPRLGGAIVDVDPETGQATAIRRVLLDETALARMEAEATAAVNGEARTGGP
jgi:metallophosphoesterase (TIGR00282 family)